MKDIIMDECYGKQIDYYNQLPNSSQVIENLLERLEKAESNNEKYKNYLFSLLEDFELSNCCGEWHFDEGGGWWEEVKLSLKFDKNQQIIIDVLETFEYKWVINPNDSNYYKLKQYDHENVEKITYETESVLYETQLTNIKNCSIIGPYSDEEYRGPQSCLSPDLPKFYWFTFKNEKTGWEHRRRQIQHIAIPEKYKNDKNFKILLELTNKE